MHNQKNDKPAVCLTYGWVRSTYAALRNLSVHGVPVWVSDSAPVGMCQLSGLKKGFRRYSNPLVDSTAFIRDINTILSATDSQVLVPSHDETEILSEKKDLLLKKLILPAPSPQLLSLANNKSLTQKLASQYQIQNAKRILYNSIEELEQGISNEIDRYVIRLCKGNGAKGVFYTTGAYSTITKVKELIVTYNLEPDRYPVIQEYVPGEGWGVSCLYWHGERIAHFTHRRLREKTETGGTSTLREHQPNSLLEEMAFKLLDNIKWHGLAMVEFKYDPVKKQGWFIEINPRLWGSIHLAISAGVEFPWLLYLCATEGPEAAKVYHQSRKILYPWKCRWYLGDCIAAMSKLSKGRIFEAIRLLLPGGADTYDDINFKDPGAFIGEIYYYLYNFVKYRSANPVREGMIG